MFNNLFLATKCWLFRFKSSRQLVVLFHFQILYQLNFKQDNRCGKLPATNIFNRLNEEDSKSFLQPRSTNSNATPFLLNGQILSVTEIRCFQGACVNKTDNVLMALGRKRNATKNLMNKLLTPTPRDYRNFLIALHNRACIPLRYTKMSHIEAWTTQRVGSGHRTCVEMCKSHSLYSCRLKSAISFTYPVSVMCFEAKCMPKLYEMILLNWQVTT